MLTDNVQVQHNACKTHLPKLLSSSTESSVYIIKHMKVCSLFYFSCVNIWYLTKIKFEMFQASCHYLFQIYQNLLHTRVNVTPVFLPFIP